MTHRSTWITPEDARDAIVHGRGRGIKVAIIDSGVELSHPRLSHLRLVDDLAFELSESGVVRRSPGLGVDTFGHGSAVAATILRCAPEAQLGSFRVMDHRLASRHVIIEEAARIALDLGYHIVNCSFGGRATTDAIEHYKPWVDAAYRRGVHVVSACNNGNFRVPEWPGHFPSVITVNMARLEADDLLFRWEPVDDDHPQHLVEFAARGVDLEVPWREGQVVTRTGSSFAAPHATGLLARLLSIHPELKPPVAKALLQEVALPWDVRFVAPNH